MLKLTNNQLKHSTLRNEKLFCCLTSWPSVNQTIEWYWNCAKIFARSLQRRVELQISLSENWDQVAYNDVLKWRVICYLNNEVWMLFLTLMYLNHMHDMPYVLPDNQIFIPKQKINVFKIKTMLYGKLSAIFRGNRVKAIS